MCPNAHPGFQLHMQYARKFWYRVVCVLIHVCSYLYRVDMLHMWHSRNGRRKAIYRNLTSAFLAAGKTSLTDVVIETIGYKVPVIQGETLIHTLHPHTHTLRLP